jgi:hypothetical protein
MDNSSVPNEIRDKLDEISTKENAHRFQRFILSALSGIPWVGGLLSATASYTSDITQGRVNELHQLWLSEHTEKIEKLGFIIYEILKTLETFGADVRIRVESDEYQDLVKKGFKAWDNADTDNKQDLIKNLLTNSGASKICTDDVIRLFIDWINTYHEAHFLIIKEIYKSPNISRGHIWSKIRGETPRENSPEADLYKMLIRDLSTGGVIRQHRETDYHGNFVKKQSSKSRGSQILKSAFDTNAPYELTELGKQFVHYTMNEVVPRIK